MWTFRFESFHKDFKMYARVVTSRVNICMTLGIKASLKFSYRLMTNEKPDPIRKFSHISNSIFYLDIKILLNLSDAEEESAFYNSEVEYSGTLYKKGFYIITNNGGNAELFKIEGAVYHKDSFFLIVKAVTIVSYSQGLRSYEVGGESETIDLKNLKDYNTPPVHIHYIPNGVYVRPKVYF